jgi:hypothetical protein
LNVHPTTSAHGVAKGANELLRQQTVLPGITSAISLIFTFCLPHADSRWLGERCDRETEGRAVLTRILSARLIYRKFGHAKAPRIASGLTW